MAHSVVASARNILVGATSHTVTLSSGVAAGDSIALLFSDRTGGASISSVADDDGNSGYTLRSTYTNGTALTAVYVCENIAAASGGSLVITVTTTGSVSSQVVAVAIRSDTGGGVYPTFDQAATPLHTGSNVTEIESNTLTASAAGLLLGMLATGNTQGTTPTVGDHASLTGETVAPAGGAGVRSFAVYGANAAGGTLGFTAAASAAVTVASTNGQFHLINFIDSGGSGAATITPTTGSVVMQGLAASLNSFTAVFIREVLINEAGSPMANRTGISLHVWYSGRPDGVADLSYSDLTTDANGTASWNLAIGGLTYNQQIFYVATDGGASLSAYTCARMLPTYQ